jgi:cyclase
MNLPDRIRVYMGKDNRVNSVVVLGEKGTVVIDTQVTLEDGKAVKQLAEQSSGGRPIIAVAITHEHFDHIAGNQFFDCNIIATQEARQDIVSSLADLNQRMPGLSATPPNISYSERCELSAGDVTLVMKREGGHCKGESSIFIPEIGTLVAGDLVFNGRTPFVGGADITEWVTALTRLHALNPDTVIPGHGEPGTKTILIEQRNWLERFMDAALSCKRKGMTADNAVTQVLASMKVGEDRRRMFLAAVNKLYGGQAQG